MASLNQCNLIGNVGKLEARFMPNGDAVTNISIAINEKWKNKEGVKQEKTEWVNIVFYKKLAEIVSEYVKVGSSIFVSGRISTRKWEKDGVTRYSTEIIGDNMQMLGSKDGGSNEDESMGNESAPSQAPRKEHTSFDDFDEQIPFS